MRAFRAMTWAAMAAAALPVWAQMNAKGIYLDTGEKPKPAIRFTVLLNRDGQERTVPATTTFRDGDKWKFQFELNKNSYIYILHRTVDGQNVDRYAGAKGIEVIRDEDRKAKRRESYELLYPNQKSGENNLVRAHKVKTIPENSVFRMDENPGMEKLLVVVSQKPLDLTKYFDVTSGKLLGGEDADAGHTTPHNDTDDDVLGQLTRSLLDYSGNAAVDPAAHSSKGIDIVDDYAAAKSGEKPMMIPVDMKHVKAPRS